MKQKLENEIIQYLPYTNPFLFVDSIERATDMGVIGHYTFKEDEYFYKGHFKDHPVTPGVILAECMAQIGVVCLGIFLNITSEGDKSQESAPGIVLSNSDVNYYQPVYPGEKVKVESEKLYYRFGKMKCKVRMWNEIGTLVCQGEISGMSVG